MKSTRWQTLSDFNLMEYKAESPTPSMGENNFAITVRKLGIQLYEVKRTCKKNKCAVKDKKETQIIHHPWKVKNISVFFFSTLNECCS